MLALTFRLGEHRHGADARRVVEVLPLLPLHGVAGPLSGLRGMLAYGNRAIPVFDLGMLLHHCPCEPRLSTRIILVRGPGQFAEAPPLVGLVAERVVRVAEVGDDAIRLGRMPGPRNPHLGPLAQVGDELIQLVDLESLAATACGTGPAPSER